ncbi:hypothetical protein ACIHAR_39410, partial [Streptomyces sp. NPDC052016]
MQTSTKSTGRAVGLAVGAILITGCGGGVEASAPTSSPAAASPSPPSSAMVPFSQKAVLKDLRAAVAAAGLTGSKVEAGFGVFHARLIHPDTENERKAAALVTRLTPCVVLWSPTEQRYRSPDAADPADSRRQLDVVLSGLATRGWKETQPSTDAPLGDYGTYFMASYKKEGWFLQARHIKRPALDEVTIMATEQACFDRLTDEERALVG